MRGLFISSVFRYSQEWVIDVREESPARPLLDTSVPSALCDYVTLFPDSGGQSDAVHLVNSISSPAHLLVENGLDLGWVVRRKST